MPTIKQDLEGQGQRPRVPGCGGAGMAERSCPASKVRGGGQEELPLVQGQGRCPRPGAAAGRSNTMYKEWWLRGHRRA